MSITDLSASDLSAKLESRELSAVEVMSATLERISAVNGDLNAIVSLRDADDLLAEAAKADASPRKGWLHGIPMAVKDLIPTAGIRTTWGSLIYADHVPDQDGLLAKRLKADGAILIGKTNTPEFGLGSNTFNPVHGITTNAYDSERSCGGSSGGAAVALAARMVSVADGSDMMGSLRNPAAWSNVYGHRPTYGLVPGDAQGDSFLHQLSTLGPMARNPTDLARLLQTLAGPDPLQPWGQEFDAEPVAKSPIAKGKRIGWLGDWGSKLTFESEILPLCEDALQIFEDLGAVVEPVAAPHPLEKIWEAWTTLRSWAVAAKTKDIWDNPVHRKRLKADAVWEIERGLGFSAIEVYEASALASEWFRAAALLFQTYDALVLPTAQVWAFPKDWEWPSEINGVKMDTYHRWMEVTVPVSVIGLPSVNVPVGFGLNGLPMGMQLFGPRGADQKILQIANAYHHATDWPNRRPPEFN